MRTSLSIVLLFLYIACYSQNYEKVDRKIDSYGSDIKTTASLASKISSDFNTPEDKIRAVFYWIATNIRYDKYRYENNLSRYNEFKITDAVDQEDYNKKRENKYIQLCFEDRKAVCHGYALIFKDVCDKLGLESVYISGFTKLEVDDIGKLSKNSLHAWNAVKLNGEWYLIDTTWSTSLSKNKNESSNFYYFTDPKQFVLNHFPYKSKWQLLDQPISAKKFYRGPVLYKHYHKTGLKLSPNQSGYLGIKKSTKKIEIKFNSVDTTKTIYYAFNNQKYSKPLDFIERNNYYVASIFLPRERSRKLTLYYKHYGAITFKMFYH